MTLNNNNDDVDADLNNGLGDGDGDGDPPEYNSIAVVVAPSDPALDQYDDIVSQILQLEGADTRLAEMVDPPPTISNAISDQDSQNERNIDSERRIAQRVKDLAALTLRIDRLSSTAISSFSTTKTRTEVQRTLRTLQDEHHGLSRDLDRLQRDLSTALESTATVAHRANTLATLRTTILRLVTGIFDSATNDDPIERSLRRDLVSQISDLESHASAMRTHATCIASLNECLRLHRALDSHHANHITAGAYNANTGFNIAEIRTTHRVQSVADLYMARATNLCPYILTDCLPENMQDCGRMLPELGTQAPDRLDVGMLVSAHERFMDDAIALVWARLEDLRGSKTTRRLVATVNAAIALHAHRVRVLEGSLRARVGAVDGVLRQMGCAAIARVVFPVRKEGIVVGLADDARLFSRESIASAVSFVLPSPTDHC